MTYKEMISHGMNEVVQRMDSVRRCTKSRTIGDTYMNSLSKEKKTDRNDQKREETPVVR